MGQIRRRPFKRNNRLVHGCSKQTRKAGLLRLFYSMALRRELRLFIVLRWGLPIIAQEGRLRITGISRPGRDGRNLAPRFSAGKDTIKNPHPGGMLGRRTLPLCSPHGHDKCGRISSYERSHPRRVITGPYNRSTTHSLRSSRGVICELSGHSSELASAGRIVTFRRPNLQSCRTKRLDVY